MGKTKDKSTKVLKEAKPKVATKYAPPKAKVTNGKEIGIKKK